MKAGLRLLAEYRRGELGVGGRVCVSVCVGVCVQTTRYGLLCPADQHRVSQGGLYFLRLYQNWKHFEDLKHN